MDPKTSKRVSLAAGAACLWVLLFLLLGTGEHHVAPLESSPLPVATPRPTTTAAAQASTPRSTPAPPEKAQAVLHDNVAPKKHGASHGDEGDGGHEGVDGGKDGGESAGDRGHDDDGEEQHQEGARRKPLKLVQPLLPEPVLRLLSESSMIDVMGNTTLRDGCEWDEKESKSNVAFMKAWSLVMRDGFPPQRGGAPDGSGLHWFLDEGGLIGSSRAGAMANADDDFDFFVILPNQHAPCRPDSLTCTEAEYEDYIYDFLMTFWKAGMCINKFNPDRKKFKSRRRLMYSFQLNRPDGNPEKCFSEGKPFAHMHLGIFLPNGKLKTNMWAHGSTHPMDELDLSIMLPVTRCRAGPVDAPCPRNVTQFLTVRNRGEYRSGGDGSCLLVRKKWGAARKRSAVERTKQLSACGYNTMVDLVPAYVASDYTTC